MKIWANLAATAIALAFAAWAGLRTRELGLRAEHARSALWGLAIGVAMALPLVLYVLLAPFITGETVGPGDVGRQSAGELAWRVGVRVPIGTAVPEEMLFRGVLFALWLRGGGVVAAIAGTAAAFGMWHAVINFDTVSNTGAVDGAVMTGLAYAVMLLGLTAGGAFFAVLRWRTKSIAAPVIVHWAINALVIAAVWARA